jgi:hypothetical protein
MATIGAAVSAETKGQLEALAAARNLTSSRLAASLIIDFLAREMEPGAPPTQALLPPEVVAARGGSKTEQVFVRLDPYYHAELGRLAAERNWYRGTYLAQLFRAHADRRPVLCEAEINAVRQVARQLADMGRNINQIARKLNASLEHAHLVASVDFELIKMLLELETNAVKDLMKANLQGWGVSDAEATEG